MNQGGLKHAATESRLDTKRERRRGASGRAAALRRAPSDSDCSGETASLSADSGDRAVRPPPPPARAAKSRRPSFHSRRRGSEWEVLEGLKDGQRFEKRPDVFNGYLHKKRKWPLKGWHKRFFVVDGGILVYARSPTDVARGRLHGSVDVGLSVISAKARRRRIDIDADEFIYHLRAKTADVFRTWLNVLKTHRLYRQHLLTFGARESVPKIHAPHDDLPPTDGSTRTSRISIRTSVLSSTEDFHQPINSTTSSSRKLDNSEPSNINEATKVPLFDWHFMNREKKLIFFNFQKTTNAIERLNNVLHNKNRSLCSMNCFARFNTDNADAKSPQGISQTSNKTEKQVHTTDLESNSVNIKSWQNSNSHKNTPSSSKYKSKVSKFMNNKIEPTYYFLAHKNRNSVAGLEIRGVPEMKKSRKSTNLVKYRNTRIEPTLKEPISKCLLLKNYRFPRYETKKHSHKQVECNPVLKKHSEAQATVANKEHKSLQDLLTVSECDKITEKIMMSLLEKHKIIHNTKEKDMDFYINQVVKELYDVKLSHAEIHPVEMLFRSLLEYWLKNTTEEPFRNAVNCVKSVGKPSNKHFTKDEILSSYAISYANKQTQFHGISDYVNTNGLSRSIVSNKTDTKEIRCHSPKRKTESFEKERRIQELETILKNTVYVCETVRSNQSRERDISITKKLIKNIEMISKKSVVEYVDEHKIDNSNSSSELPKIQDTINHLISDTAMPADVAKEFLNAYLGILLDSSKSITSSSQSSEPNSRCNEPICDVVTEAIQKHISKSVITANLENNINTLSYTVRDRATKHRPEKDFGELYLKEMLDKIPTIYSKADNKRIENYDKSKGDKIDTIHDELGRHTNEYPGKNLIHENVEDNSIVIDLSKYDLECISMLSDPALKGAMSINIKLKEKPSHFGESKTQQLSLKFYNDNKCKSKRTRPDEDWLTNLDSTSLKKIFEPIDRNLTTGYDFETPKDNIELKPYMSSDATSKACFRILHESEHSIDLSFNSSNFFRKDISDNNEDAQSCYLVSSFKKSALAKLQSKKKVRLKHSNGLLVNAGTRLNSTSQASSSRYPDEYSVFEEAAPKIIDEKFILLLFENLTLLSKNIPSIYKDLNGLYMKLRKKHEKVVRNNNNIHGLSLLGKIYNDDCRPNNCETQYETTEFKVGTDVKIIKNYEDAAVTTNLIIEDTPIADSCLSACNITFVKKVTEVQTDTVFPQLKRFTPVAKACSSKNFIHKEYTCISQAVTSAKKEWHNTEHGTSVQRWYDTSPTKECAISTVIKTILDNPNSVGSFRIARITDNVHVLKVDRDILKCDYKENSNRNYWFEGLTSSCNISSESPTDKRFERTVNDVNYCNNNVARKYNVYQLSLRKNEPHKSNSTMDSRSLSNMSDDLKTVYRCCSEPSYCSGLISPTSPPLRGPQAGFVSGTPGGRLASWIIESGGPLENASRSLGQAQLSVQQLQRLLDALELHQQPHHDTDVSLEGASPNVKKDRRKFGLRKKKSNSKCVSAELAPHIDPSSSHMALSALTAPPSPGGGASSMPNSAASLPIACAAARPQSLPAADSIGAAGPASLTSLTPDHQLREDFTVLAKDLVTSLKGIVSTLVMERGRLRAAVEATESSPGALLAALRTNLSSALHQNNELRSRLSRIHDASDLAEMSSMGPNSDPQGNRQFQQSLSYSSSCVSASEFFDAEEHDDDLKTAEIIPPDEAGVIELDGDSSSEAGSLSSEDGGSASSDNSDVLSAEQVTLRLNQNGGSRPASGASGWSRRTRLPAPRPTPGGPSLWHLLCKNIGKDLSQVSMPVTINEPLNMLQRLCEELEYSELLDAAAECKSSVERMALIAAFAVSAYASSAHRAASKPFNPLLGETYECVRGDKGFRFVAEQVSHHPPISACHAESSRWCFWQEARIKTKFWGKSMEFQPAGRVHVRLTTTGDHYSWNKVTTCVHNLFGGQRWVDQYGDMHLTCHGTDIACKLNFIKASSWSSSRHEVRGSVSGEARLRLQGRWSEAVYAGEPPAARCLWRPGAMPPEHELYYGFTRFAMELNEMEPSMQEQLPRTDTRFRPDQRALEQGDVDAAEQFKHELEQAQRERRRLQPAEGPLWFRKGMEGGEETWVFTGEYWRARDAGFPAHTLPRIW